MDDYLYIGLHVIEVLPTVAYAHNTSRMWEDGTVKPLLYSMATKVEHQQRHDPQNNSSSLHTSDMLLQIKKEEFLANRENNQRFINIPNKELAKAGCCCFHANEDADLMIVKTALNSSNKIDTILIGEDTDLLVLLFPLSTGTLSCILNIRA